MKGKRKEKKTWVTVAPTLITKREGGKGKNDSKDFC